MRAFAIRREVGVSRAGSLPRSSGIPENCSRASASSYQHDALGQDSRTLLQSARHCRAVDKGREGCDQLDAAVMQDIRCQRRSPSTARVSVQHGKLSANARDARADEGLVAHQPPGELIKIGAKVVRHGRYVAFQMAEVAIPRHLFAEILRLIADLRSPRPCVPT